MYKKEIKLTDAEIIRLEEIAFWDFVKKIFKINSSPVKIYAFIEVICTLADCSILTINEAINICIGNGRLFRPMREERVWLYHKAAVPIRKTLPLLKISKRDYYKILSEKEPDIQPKFPQYQYIDIVKFLDYARNLVPERIE